MNLDPQIVGLLGFVVLLVLLVSGMPVAFAMALVGVVGFALLRSPEAAMSLLAIDFYDTLSRQSFTVIPLFVLMGQVAFHAGISRRLFATAYTWMGALPGGLAMATVGACTAFGAICGSGPATSATMAAVALPEMKRYKYDMALATGTVASGGTLGMMIPPSVVFICYAILTQESVGDLFLAGVLPGLVTGGLFCLAIYALCARRPAMGPAGPRTTIGQKFAALTGAGETLVLFAAVIGGMFVGFFTPTEAAAIGAGVTILIAFARRQLGPRLLWRAVYETLRTSCMVLIIVAGAMVFGRFLAITSIPFELAKWLSSLPLPGWTIIGVIILFYLFAGCFVDALALLLLTVPIFQPVVTGLGYDLVWFGVMIVLVTQMGTITPPVGVCAYVVNGIERDVPLQTVFKGCLPFLAVLILAAVLLMLVPGLATWLPEWSARLAR